MGQIAFYAVGDHHGDVSSGRQQVPSPYTSMGAHFQPDAGRAMEVTLARQFCESPALAIGCWRADGRFTAANNALLNLIGYTHHEMDSGQVRWSEITPPEYAPLDQQALEEIKAIGFCQPFEKEYVRKDGVRVPVLIGAAAIGRGVTDAGTFYAVNLCARKPAVARSTEIPPEIVQFNDRQRLIALLSALGESNKKVAQLLDIGLRTAELAKHQIAARVGIDTGKVGMWAIKNNQALLSTIQDTSSVPDSVASLIGLAK